jgi:mannose/cellobiose epimerase-like protein (N-acyl-D-glucosamine 2-epimerase family)
MVMDEAIRRGDNALFDLAAERFRRHVEVSWDDIYGGVFRGIRHVDRNEWLLDRVLWVQEEVLIGCLLMVEHRHDRWAEEMFDRMYRYVRANYPLAPHGLPLWINAADRKVTFEPHYNRVENYHHPRHLMLNLIALERMKNR